MFEEEPEWGANLATPPASGPPRCFQFAVQVVAASFVSFFQFILSFLNHPLLSYDACTDKCSETLYGETHRTTREDKQREDGTTVRKLKRG